MTTLIALHTSELEVVSPGELDSMQRILSSTNVGCTFSIVTPGSTVIPRFRAIPFGREFEDEVLARSARLINSYHEHRWIANCFSWADILDELTPACHHLDELPDLPEGEYFVKGETNSLKNSWFDGAYAPNKRAVIDVVSRVSQDLYLGSQEVVIRPLQKYRVVGTGVTGRPLFHERRVFVYRGTILASGWYWSSYPEYHVDALDERLFEETLQKAARRISTYAPYVVIDLAEYPDGSWGVIELNDGSMSGLSDVSATELYTNLKACVESETTSN